MVSRRTCELLGLAAGVALCLTVIFALSSAGVPIGRALDGLTLVAVDAKRPDLIIERLGEAGTAAKSAETNSESIAVICERCRRARKAGGLEHEDVSEAAGPGPSREPDGRDSRELGDTTDRAGTDDEEAEPVEPPLDGEGRIDIALSGLPTPERLGLTGDPPTIGITATRKGHDGRWLEVELGRAGALTLPAGVWDLGATCSAMRRSGRLEGIVVKAGATVSVSVPMDLDPELAIIVLTGGADIDALGFDVGSSDSCVEVSLLPVGIGPVSSSGELLDSPRGKGLTGSTATNEGRLEMTLMMPPDGRYLLLVRYGFGRVALSEVVTLSGTGQEIIRELPTIRPTDMLTLSVRSSRNRPVAGAELELQGALEDLRTPLWAEVGPGQYRILFPTLFGAAARLAAPWVLRIRHSSIPEIELPLRAEAGQRTVLATPGATICVQVEGLPPDTAATSYLMSTDRGLNENVEDGVAIFEGVPSGPFILTVDIEGPFESSSEVSRTSLRVSGDASLTVRVPRLHALSVRTDLEDGTMLRLVRPGSVVRSLVSGGAVHFGNLIAGGDWQLDGDARSELPRCAVTIPTAGPVDYRSAAGDRLAVRVTGPGYLRDQGFKDGDRLLSIDGRPIGQVLESDPIWSRTKSVQIVVDRNGRQVQLQAEPQRLTRLESHLGGAFELP